MLCSSSSVCCDYCVTVNGFSLRVYFACITYFYSFIYNLFSLSSPHCVPDTTCVVLSHKWLMTPLHVAKKLRGWIVLERGIVKFTASTKQLWTTRLGIAHNTIQSSLSLPLSLSSYPFSSSPSCSPLVSPLLRSTYIWDPLTCRNVLAHDVTTNISCRSP